VERDQEVRQNVHRRGALLWWAFTHATTEVIVVANDLDQSVSRVFKTMVDLLAANPALGASATIKAQEIVLSNGTTIRAIASEYRGAAGARHSLVIFDELWRFDSERAQRLYEEPTPPPTEPDAWVLVVTYAGFLGESTLLEAIYRRGLAGTRVDDRWSYTRRTAWRCSGRTTPRHPWQTPAYYAEQARSLRPTTFARLHRDEWVSAESTFLTAALWDACVTPPTGPLLPTRAAPLFVGVDASTKHDSSAVVAVHWDALEQLVREPHRGHRRALKRFVRAILDLLAPGSRGTRAKGAARGAPRCPVPAPTLRAVDGDVKSAIEAHRAAGSRVPDAWRLVPEHAADARLAEQTLAGMGPSEVSWRLLAARLGQAWETVQGWAREGRGAQDAGA
jgi:hypothetical protein